MQAKMCSRCGKNVAVVFITKLRAEFRKMRDCALNAQGSFT